MESSRPRLQLSRLATSTFAVPWRWRSSPSAPPARLIALALTFVLLVTSCSAGAEQSESTDGQLPDELAFGDEAEDGDPENGDPAGAQSANAGTETIPTTIRPTTSTTAPATIELGHPARPFVELPDASQARAVMTETGVVLPVINERSDHWLVSTPCQAVTLIRNARPIHRAHVVLDAGHGGSEVGAAGATGLTEKELNLSVATKTKELLEAAGATVVMTRNGDYSLTAASRGLIAKAIDPALFVSIHHNGGAPATDGGPGTIVFTKSGNTEATRFGGLFYERLQPMLTEAASIKQLDYEVYTQALDAHEATVLAYDQSLATREAALVANGQLPPPPPTDVPAPTTTIAPTEPRLPSVRQNQPTTTLPISAETPVPVPEALPLPPPFMLEPVRAFRWAGAGNSGVRSWVRPDGGDYLAVLRHSEDVPAVLAEFLYLTNPSEEELLIDPTFVDAEAQILADTIIEYFSTENEGSGFVKDQFDDQPIGSSGGIDDCVEPALKVAE